MVRADPCAELRELDAHGFGWTRGVLPSRQRGRLSLRELPLFGASGRRHPSLPWRRVRQLDSPNSTANRHLPWPHGRRWRGLRRGPHAPCCRSRLHAGLAVMNARDRQPAAGSWQRGTGAQPSPLPLRWAGVGAAALGAIGAIVGLVVGLIVHPPTALFAMLEIGIPATLVGGLAGLGSGSIVSAARHIGDRRRGER